MFDTVNDVVLQTNINVLAVGLGSLRLSFCAFHAVTSNPIHMLTGRDRIS